MAQMLGASGMAGTGCSPRCRKTHAPRPKRDKRAQRAKEKRDWSKSIVDAIEEVFNVLTS